MRVQERLQTLEPSASFEERKQWKETLIDVWIFAARYDISKLQNETMLALILLLNTPHLLNKTDIAYIWDRTASTSDRLRRLSAMAVVVQIEDGMLT